MNYRPLLFVVATIICWGCYIPTLHKGQTFLGGGSPGKGSLRAFLLVGVAYFLTAVLVPLGLLYSTEWEPRTFDGSGIRWALVAGVLGSLGALGIILALKTGGTPQWVPSLVFAGAPIVNVLVTMLWLHKPANPPNPLFYVGMILAATGAGMVLYFKPA